MWWGGAGILVDPQDVDKIAGAVGHVLNDPALQESLRSAAVARAHLFSWDKAARETLAVYRGGR